MVVGVDCCKSITFNDLFSLTMSNEGVNEHPGPMKV